MEMRDFTNALAQLPDDQREAIILVGASGFSYEEAAEICGCALGTIKSRVNRARVRLQETMQIAEGAATFGPDAAAAAVILR
jgi:RNA polymerase sigma-70 factor (ECF subfamily)